MTRKVLGLWFAVLWLQASSAFAATISDDGKLVAYTGWDQSSVQILNVEKGERHSNQFKIKTGLDVFPKENIKRMEDAARHGQIALTLNADPAKLATDTAFFPGSHTLCLLEGSQLVLIDGDERRVIRAIPFSVPTAGANLAVSPSAEQITFTEGDQRAHTIDLSTGKILHVLQDVSSSNAGSVIQYDSSGHLIATLAKEKDAVKVWDSAKGVLVKTFRPPTQKATWNWKGTEETIPITGFAWIPASTQIVVARPPELLIYDSANGKFVKSIRVGLTDVDLYYAKPWAPYSIAVSADGRRIAVAGWSEKVSIWDVNAGTLIKTLKLPTQLPQVRFLKDGKRLLCYTTYGHGPLAIVDIDSGAVLYQTPRDPP